MANRRFQRQRRGVTLLECLIAILVLAVGVVSGVQCLNAAMMLVTKANRVAVASAMARETIESIVGQSADGFKENEANLISADEDYDATTTTGTVSGRVFWEERVNIERSTMIRDGRETGGDEGRLLFPGGVKIIRIEDYVDAANPKINTLTSVTVTVQWNTGAGTQDVRMATLITKNMTLGR